MGRKKLEIWAIFLILLVACHGSIAQNATNDTIRLGAVADGGKTYPMVFLPEFVKITELMDPDERKRRNRLRNDVFVVYPYALTAAAIFKDVNTKLDKMETRHERKKYLKSIDKTLDNTFKEPLKNLSIDQGHVLIKLIDRQTGQSCYSIIKELKGGFSAVLWQSVGVFFNNNLSRDYDPDGRDKEVEDIVKELEASAAYRYQLYQQEALLKKINRP